MKFIWFWPLTTLFVGVLGMSAVWLAIALFSNQACGWLAWAGAADIALMLKLTQAPRGQPRVWLAVLCTALIVFFSQWLIIATRMGFALGIEPLPSALRLGSVLAWEFTQLNLQRSDWVFIVLSLPLVGLLSSGMRMRR